MRERLTSDLRFILARHRWLLLALSCIAFQLIFLIATAHGTRSEIRKQLDQPIAGSTYRQLATMALNGNDPAAETDGILAAMFGTLVLLNVASAVALVSNTMLLVVDQRRPLLARARALGASRKELVSQVRLIGALACAATVLPAIALAWLFALALNATNVLHVWLDINPPLFGLAVGLLGLAGLFGSWFPARAVAAIDPWDALRKSTSNRRALIFQIAVIAISFWLALLLVGLGSGVREATLEKFRALPIVDKGSFDALYGKVDQSMTSFRLILLVLPLLNCVSIVASTVHLAAHRQRQRLALDRSLGESSPRLRGRIVAESIRLCLLAWLIAAPLAYLAAAALETGVLPFSTSIPAWGLPLTLGSAGLIGLAGGLGPASAALRSDPSAQLRMKA